MHDITTHRTGFAYRCQYLKVPPFILCWTAHKMGYVAHNRWLTTVFGLNPIVLSAFCPSNASVFGFCRMLLLWNRQFLHESLNIRKPVFPLGLHRMFDSLPHFPAYMLWKFSNTLLVDDRCLFGRLSDEEKI